MVQEWCISGADQVSPAVVRCMQKRTQQAGAQRQHGGSSDRRSPSEKEHEGNHLMLATASACTGCEAALGSAVQPVRLLDLTFHDLCAPECRACGRRLGGADESQWRYSTRAVAGVGGPQAGPTAFWCPSCWSRAEVSRQ
jgi:hypothetical protein